MRPAGRLSADDAAACETITVTGVDRDVRRGIQADLKTIGALGCYGMTAITAITVQNTLGVSAFILYPPEILCGQIDAVLGDMAQRP